MNAEFIPFMQRHHSSTSVLVKKILPGPLYEQEDILPGPLYEQEDIRKKSVSLLPLPMQTRCRRGR